MRQVMTVLVCVVLGLAAPAAAERPPTANELISRGEVHEAKSEFAAAIKLYVELEKLPNHAGIANYLQARASYLNGDLQGSQRLVIKAIQKVNEPWKFKSKLLYGEILFKQGLYVRAKDVFVMLRAQQGDATRKAELVRRVIECNRRLGLDERDGL